MKLKLLLLISILVSFVFVSADNALVERINRYSGKNANDLLTYLDSLSGLKAYYADFLLTHMSDNDLAAISPNYLDEGLTYAIKTLNLPYTYNIPEEYFLHYVLPLRVSQEPFEEWRKEFYEKLQDQISGISNINEAILIADLFYQEGIYFRQTSARDQAPITCIKRGYGRCEEMMILQMAVFRAIGIPCRPASAPYWSFTDSNHVWTEVWTPQGWMIVPEAYPEKYRKSSWEVDRAKKAPFIITEAYGSYDSPLTLEKTNYDTKLNITDVYGETVTTKVRVVDSENMPISDAQIVYYATSFGGLFDLFACKSNLDGEATIDFRPSSLFVTAGKEGKTGHGLINSFLSNNEITIMISENNVINENLILNFPLDSSTNKDFGITQANKEYLESITELANQRRDNRLLKNKKTCEFITNYPLPDKTSDLEEYKTRRSSYLSKCEELAGNVDNWLAIDKWISISENAELKRKIMIDLVIEWDIKDLIEFPDSLAIKNTINTLTNNYLFYKNQYDYSLFKSNVLKLPFSANPFPQTGWQADLALITNSLKIKNIEKTVKRTQEWLKENTIRDKQANWSYFGGSLTPIQLINKKYLSQNQQIYLLTAMLQNAGVALRWQGFLEFYNGSKWVEIILEDLEENNDTPPLERKLITFELNVSVDGKEINPEPYGNFLIASASDNGILSNTWFDFEEKEGKTFVKFNYEANQQNYIQGYVRNKNGDANLIIKAVDSETTEISLDFKTPGTTNENRITWSNKTLTNIDNLLKQHNLSEKKVLLFILNEQGNEPQERMIEQLLSKVDDFAQKDVQILLYSENREINNVSSLKKTNFTYLKAGKIIEDNINLENYPIIFLYDENNIVTSANGFDLNLINYLFRLVD